MSEIKVRPLRESDRDWVSREMRKLWHSEIVISRGRVHHARDLPGYVAERQGQEVGFALYEINDDVCELVVILSLQENQGVGTNLMTSVKNMAIQSGCDRLWLITTNDNLLALGFYQKQGFRLVAVYPSAMTETRRLKPAIPTIGLNGIPLRDEIELEMRL